VPDRADKKKGRASLRAAWGLTNLSVATVSAVGAAALHSWPILALGATTYAALVAWDVVRGASQARAAAAPPSLDRPDAYTDAGIRDAVRILLTAKGEVDKVLSETPEDVKGNLALALVSVEELLKRAATLARRGEVLAGYLVTKDPRVVQQDVEHLRRRAASAADPQVRAQYETARASRAEHLQVLVDLANARERVLASLLSIASSLEALPAKVVRMRALDADAMDKLTGDVNGELAGLNDEIRTFEDTLKTLGDVSA
jgi:hypothetical protein